MNDKFEPRKEFYDADIWEQQDFDAKGLVNELKILLKNIEFVNDEKRYFSGHDKYFKDTGKILSKYFNKYKDMDRERMMMIIVDGMKNVIYAKTLSKGSKRSCTLTNSTLIKELNKLAKFQDLRCYVYFVHNHPGGTLEPSKNDLICLNKRYNLLAEFSDIFKFGDYLISAKGADEVYSARYSGYISRLQIRLHDFNLPDDNYEADQKLKQELEVYLKQFENKEEK